MTGLRLAYVTRVVDEVEEAAERVEAVLRLDGAQRSGLGARLRPAVVDDHSLDKLFEKILHEVVRFEEDKARPRSAAR